MTFKHNYFMAWKNPIDTQEELIAVAVIMIVGLYVIFSFVSKSVLLALFGIVLTFGFIASVGWAGFRYWNTMRRRNDSR